MDRCGKSGFDERGAAGYRIVVGLLALGACLFAAGPAAFARRPPPPTNETVAVLNQINAERASQRTPPLALDGQLTSVAQAYANDMARRNFFSHVSPEGLDPFARMRRAGYRFGYAGENIAFNVDAVRAQITVWNDPPHRHVLVNPHFSRVGIGTARGRNGVILVEDFSD